MGIYIKVYRLSDDTTIGEQDNLYVDLEQVIMPIRINKIRWVNAKIRKTKINEVIGLFGEDSINEIEKHW